METVGKTYMAVAGSKAFDKMLMGLSDSRKHHSVKMLNYAF